MTRDGKSESSDAEGTTRRDPDRFVNYRALVAKVDAKTSAITAAVKSRMRCGRGCHACCAPALTVAEVERAHLAQFVAATPGLAAELQDLAAQDPHHGSRCAFLRADGDCAVYVARPIICRSHGLPVEVRDDADAGDDDEAPAPRRDVCPLNFVGEDLSALPGDQVLNLQLLDTLLGLIDAKYCEDAGVPRRRAPLLLRSLIDPR